MKIVFLGTGTSTGNPEIGCQCEVCTSKDPRDWRLRASILVETEGKRILIDCGPDFRWQMITNKINLVLHTIGTKPFEAAGVMITPIRVMHAKLPILGFRIGNMAYLTDLKYLPEEEYAKLENLDVLVIDALRKGEHQSHESLEEALANISRIQPKEAYLIHMSHRIGLHAVIEKELPPHVHYSYDGLTVTF